MNQNDKNIQKSIKDIYDIVLGDTKKENEIVSHETISKEERLIRTMKDQTLETLKRQFKRYSEEQERNHHMTLQSVNTESRNLYHQATLESIIAKNTVYETAILLGFNKEDIEND